MKRAKNHDQMWKRLMQAWDEGPACQVELATHFTRASPEIALGWMVLADGLAKLERYQDARAALQKAKRVVTPEQRWFLAVQWGHFYGKRHDERQAERWYRKALALKRRASTHIYLGANLATQGLFREAKKHFRRAIQLARRPGGDPPDEAYYNLGVILTTEGKYREASIAFRKALKVDPQYKAALYALKDVEKAMQFRSGLTR